MEKWYVVGIGQVSRVDSVQFNRLANGDVLCLNSLLCLYNVDQVAFISAEM